MPNSKPNVIVFLTDDQGYGDLSCMGATDFRTPNLDQMAEDGVRFTNWYSNDIKYVSLDNFEILGEIHLDGLPEDIVSDGDYLWVTINMNMDWSDGICLGREANCRKNPGPKFREAGQGDNR